MAADVSGYLSTSMFCLQTCFKHAPGLCTIHSKAVQVTALEVLEVGTCHAFGILMAAQPSAYMLAVSAPGRRLTR
eukprot:359804-Chlamydomonas_euryale.AAC.3